MKHAKQARALNSAETVKNQSPNAVPELAAALQTFREKWKDLADQFEDELREAPTDSAAVWLLTLRIEATHLKNAVEQMASAKSAEGLADALKSFGPNKQTLNQSFLSALADADEGPGFLERLGFLRLKADWMASAAGTVAMFIDDPVDAPTAAAGAATPPAKKRGDFEEFMALDYTIDKATFLLHSMSSQLADLLEEKGGDGKSSVACGSLHSAWDVARELERDFEAACGAFRRVKGGAR